MRMAIAHLIERLGSEELQAFIAAPHGFMLEAANEDLVAGGNSIAVLITFCRNRKLLHHLGEPDGPVKVLTSLANWLQVMSLFSSSLWQHSSVCSHPTSSGQCLFACNIKCVSGCPSVCCSPLMSSLDHSRTCCLSPIVAVISLVIACGTVRPRTCASWRCATCCSSCARRSCSRPTQQPILER
jgi:hypothetical protein